jgi:hypothetical protein
MAVGGGCLLHGVYVVVRELTMAACFLRFASRALSRWLPRAMSFGVYSSAWVYGGIGWLVSAN